MANGAQRKQFCSLTLPAKTHNTHDDSHRTLDTAYELLEDGLAALRCKWKCYKGDEKIGDKSAWWVEVSVVDL